MHWGNNFQTRRQPSSSLYGWWLNRLKLVCTSWKPLQLTWQTWTVLTNLSWRQLPTLLSHLNNEGFRSDAWGNDTYKKKWYSILQFLRLGMASFWVCGIQHTTEESTVFIRSKFPSSQGQKYRQSIKHYYMSLFSSPRGQ